MTRGGTRRLRGAPFRFVARRQRLSANASRESGLSTRQRAGDDAAAAIASAATERPYGGGAKRLRFGGNSDCGARTARAVCRAMELSRSLLDVDLCDLDLPRRSLDDVCASLPNATSLQTLDVSGNPRCFGFGDEGTAAPALDMLLRALRKNLTLTRLCCARNELRSDELRKIGRALRANRCLPALMNAPVRWNLSEAGDATSELLRKLCYLDEDVAKLLRSNVSFLNHPAASDVVDAVAPPSHKCLMTNDPSSFKKLNAKNPMRKFAARRIQALYAKHRGLVAPATTGDEGPTAEELKYEAEVAAHRRATGARDPLAREKKRRNTLRGKARALRREDPARGARPRQGRADALEKGRRESAANARRGSRRASGRVG